jgi:hypothetical protein
MPPSPLGDSRPAKTLGAITHARAQQGSDSLLRPATDQRAGVLDTPPAAPPAGVSP